MEVEGEEGGMQVEQFTPKPTRRAIRVQRNIPQVQEVVGQPSAGYGFSFMLHASSGREMESERKRIEYPSTFDELCRMKVEQPLLYANLLRQQREDDEKEMNLDRVSGF